MERMKILVIEDDKYISNFIEVSLSKSGYEVLVGENAAAGLFLYASYQPDLILLDLGLPDMDGIEVIKDLRKTTEIPIIVVSARGQEREKINALDLGANDYITKPFYMGELQARIRVVERSLSKQVSQHEQTQFCCDWLTVDYEKRRVLVDGEDVHLTPLEYKLLMLLIHNRGKVLTHNYILKNVWGYESSDSKSVRTFMATLRRKIEKDTAKPRFILTEVGVGYRFSDE